MDISERAVKGANDRPDATPSDVPAAVDAIIHVVIAEGELEAYLHIEPPRNGGAAPTLDAMMAALSAAGVSRFIDTERLKKLEAEPVYDREIPVARGVAAVNGVDGTATLRIGTEKNLKPKEKEDGTVDYHDLGTVENVAQGQVLCVITLPTEGTAGVSVKGKELPQRKGRPVRSYLGKNTELSPDGTAILSQINGQIQFDGQKISVTETFYIKEDIDHSTGNIKVVRNLFVPGMVMPGFKVEAGENVTIMGRVESSAVKAGGNITVHSGVIGGEMHCDGDLKCRFIENSNIFVGGNIKAEYIINSNVRCGKSIKVSGALARIIGGSCTAGQNIEAHMIGSPANVQTRLELGADHTVLERQQKLLAQIAEMEKQIKSLRPLIALLQQLEAGNRLTPDKRQILDNANYTYDASTKGVAEATKELEEIAQAVRIRGFGRIFCTGTIYPGVKVAIGQANLTIRDALKESMLTYKDGEICVGSARR